MYDCMISPSQLELIVFLLIGTLIYDFPMNEIIPSNSSFTDPLMGNSSPINNLNNNENSIMKIENTQNNQFTTTQNSLTNTQRGNKKRKRFMSKDHTILSNIDNEQHIYDNTVIKKLNNADLLPTEVVVETLASLIFHVGKDRNIYSMEFQCAPNVRTGYKNDVLWF